MTTTRVHPKTGEASSTAVDLRPAGMLRVKSMLMTCTAVAVSVFVLPVSAQVFGERPQGSASASTPVDASSASLQSLRLANFGQETVSPESRKLADWVVNSANNGKLPFVVIDKIHARVFVFDSQGQLRGATSALLGSAIGDDSAPGIGQRPLSSIRPEERTTAAGRFVASLDRDTNGKELLWVDYDSALSLHPIVPGQPRERRAERLATPSPVDNRISFGCINVPAQFYKEIVSPAFTGTNGVVYILPETRSSQEVFGSYDVQEVLRTQASSQSSPSSYPAVR